MADALPDYDREVAEQIERGRALLTADVNPRKQASWAGYLAGFERSGEGFNGEYVGRRYRGDGALEAYLRDEFEGLWEKGKIG